MCKEAGSSISEIPTKVKNQEVVGAKGALPHRRHKLRVCVAAFDYHEANCAKTLPRLSAVRDGVRFARMAKDCGGEVREFYDRTDLAKKEHKVAHGFVSDGFPANQTILDEWKRVGSVMTANDSFVFYFTGHGISRPREVEEGNEEMMIFMEPNGTPSYLTEDEVANVITESFPPGCHILFITDCFYNSNLCDLSRQAFAGRPIIHISAVKDHRHMPVAPQGKGLMKDQPGLFTQCLLETLEKLVERPMMGDAGNPEEFSVVEVYNKILQECNARSESQESAAADAAKAGEDGSPASADSLSPKKKGDRQDFCFERTAQFDPDTFRWPFVPPAGWRYSDPLVPPEKQGLSAFSCMKGVEAE